MPVLPRIDGFRFFFYTNEHLPRHGYVEKGECTAKFNLFSVELVRSKGFKSHQINDIRKLVLEDKELFNLKWDEYFNNQ